MKKKSGMNEYIKDIFMLCMLLSFILFAVFTIVLIIVLMTVDGPENSREIRDLDFPVEFDVAMRLVALGYVSSISFLCASAIMVFVK